MYWGSAGKAEKTDAPEQVQDNFGKADAYPVSREATRGYPIYGKNFLSFRINSEKQPKSGERVRLNLDNQIIVGTVVDNVKGIIRLDQTKESEARNG